VCARAWPQAVAGTGETAVVCGARTLHQAPARARRAPCICATATALAKLQPSLTAAVVSAYAAAATGVALSARHADAVMSDTLTCEAACMRRAQGDEGGGRLNTGEPCSRRSRRSQQLLPCLLAMVRK
jgi:hypothetical protein